MMHLFVLVKKKFRNLKDELAVLENDNIRDVDQKRFAFQSGVAKVLPANDAVKQ